MMTKRGGRNPISGACEGQPIKGKVAHREREGSLFQREAAQRLTIS